MDELDGVVLCVAVALLGLLAIGLSRGQRNLAEDIRLIAEDPVLYRAKYAASGDSDHVKEHYE